MKGGSGGVGLYLYHYSEVRANWQTTKLMNLELIAAFCLSPLTDEHTAPSITLVIYFYLYADKISASLCWILYQHGARAPPLYSLGSGQRIGVGVNKGNICSFPFIWGTNALIHRIHRCFDLDLIGQTHNHVNISSSNSPAIACQTFFTSQNNCSCRVPCTGELVMVKSDPEKKQNQKPPTFWIRSVPLPRIQSHGSRVGCTGLVCWYNYALDHISLCLPWVRVHTRTVTAVQLRHNSLLNCHKLIISLSPNWLTRGHPAVWDTPSDWTTSPESSLVSNTMALFLSNCNQLSLSSGGCNQEKMDMGMNWDCPAGPSSFSRGMLAELHQENCPVPPGPISPKTTSC